jgi:hypothetical protein
VGRDAGGGVACGASEISSSSSTIAVLDPSSSSSTVASSLRAGAAVGSLSPGSGLWSPWPREREGAAGFGGQPRQHAGGGGSGGS